MNKCSGGKDFARNLNLFHAARQCSGSIAPAQSGCFWGLTNAFGQFAGSVAVSAFGGDAGSLTRLGIGAAVGRGVETTRVMSMMCIVNIVKVGLMCLCWRKQGKKSIL